MEKKNKLTSKKLIIILASFFVVCGIALGVLMLVRNSVKEVSAEKEYEYYNPDETKADTDEGFKIDGVLDEEVYQKNTWLYARNENGDSYVDLAMTSYYGEKGMYFAYDVTESTTIYVNSERSNYCNSGIEMYMAPENASNLKYNNTYEMNLLPTGEIGVYRSSGTGGFTRGETTEQYMPYLGATTKGGEVNSSDCHGYCLELFIPWEYFESQGSDIEEIKDHFMYINPAHITSYNEGGTDLNADRFWYSFATQLGGDGWSNVTKYFQFDENGLIGSVPVTFEKQEHCTITGNKTIIPGMNGYVTITPEDGYALNSILVNGEEQIKKVSYNEDGSVMLKLKSKGEAITVSASAEPITEGNKTLHGTVILHKLGGDSLNGVEISYKGPTGEKPITLNADGTFELADLTQGYYTIMVSKEGYTSLTQGISLRRDIDTELWLEYDLLTVETGTCWDIDEQNDGILNTIGGYGVVLTKDSYGKFSAESNFRYDESVKNLSTSDSYVQQRSGLRIKFSNGKYWHIDVLYQNENYIVQYAKLTEENSIFTWTKVYTMSESEAAQYKSAKGINLKVVRDGQYANVYLDNKFIAAEDLGAEYKDLTAQAGFESYASCRGITSVKFDVSTKNVKVEKTPYFSRGAGWDISKQFQGVVTLPNGGHNASLKFSQKYTDMDLTLTVRDYAKGEDVLTDDSPRTDVKFIFEDGKAVTFGVLQRKNDGKVIVQSMSDGKNMLTGWSTQYTFTDAEKALFKSNAGISFRIVRIGTEFTIYVNGVQVKVCDFDGKLSADTKADIYIRHWGDKNVDVEIPFRMSTKFDKVSITYKDNKNGTVVGEKKTYIKGDTIRVTGKGNSGYYCYSMKVDGKEVAFDKYGKASFTADKNSYVVEGSFEKTTFVDTKNTWNLTKQKEGKIILPDGGDNFNLKLAEKQTDMDLSLWVENNPNAADSATTDSPRTDVMFTFKNGKILTFGVLQRKDNGKVVIQSMGEVDGKKTLTPGWTTQYTFTDEEKAQFQTEEGIKFRIVRAGTEFSLYVGDTMVKVVDVTGLKDGDDITADMKAEVSVRHWGDKGADIEMPFAFTTKLDTVSINVTETEQGTVAGKKNTYLKGDKVVLSGKGNDGYYCIGVKIDGQKYDLDDSGTYSFVATKEQYEVEGIFYKGIFNDAEGWVLSKQHEGIITLPGGGDNFNLKLAEKQTNIDFSLWVENNPNAADSATTDSPRTDVMFTFENGKILTFGVLQRKDNGKVVIQSMGEVDGKKTLTPGWTTQYTFTDEEKAQFQTEDGIQFRILKIGTVFHLYIGDRYVKAVDVTTLTGGSSITKDMKADVAIRHWGDKGSDIEMPFTFNGDVTSVFNNASGWDFGKESEGIIILTTGAFNENLRLAEKQTNMDFTLQVKDDPKTTTAEATAFKFIFDDIGYLQFRVIEESGVARLKTMDGGTKNLLGNWKTLYTLSETEKGLFKSDVGIRIRVKRVGTVFNVYLNDKNVYSVDAATLNSQIKADTEMTVQLRQWVGADTKTIQIPFSFTNKVQSIFDTNHVLSGTSTKVTDHALWWDLSKQEHNILLKKGNGFAWLPLSKKQTNIELELTARNIANSDAYAEVAVKFVFDTGKWIEMTTFNSTSSKNVYVAIKVYKDGKQVFKEQSNNLKGTQIGSAAITEAGTTFRIIRSGDTFTVSLGGQEIFKKTLNDYKVYLGDIADDAKATVYIGHNGDNVINGNATTIEVPFKITEK